SIGRAVDSHNKELVSVRLFRREITSNSGGIVDRKNCVNLREGGQQVGHYTQPTVSAATSVLVLGQNLDARIFLKNFEGPCDTVCDCCYRRTVDDDDLTLPL